MKFRDKTEGARGGNDFVKLADGESIIGVFRGDVYDFKQHWDNGAKRGVLCTGREGCALCLKGEKPSFRFRLNLLLKEADAYVPKIFEQGWTVYENLRALHSDYDLEKTIIKITRSGTEKNTSYTILPVKNGGLTEKQDVDLSKVQLLKLEHGEGATESETSEDIPF